MTRIPDIVVKDARNFGRVGLVIGGDSAEREVSLNGGKAVAASMTRSGIVHEVFDGPLALFDGINAGRVDRVFNLLHGPGGEDGSLQGALSLMSVPFTGAGLAASALTMDKVRSKWIWQQNGIATPGFETLGPGSFDTAGLVGRLGLPMFIKPTGLGSSIGISRVTDEAGVVEAVEIARQYGDWVICESEVLGGEYFAGIIEQITLPLIRIETPREFYDYEAKYESDDTRYHCPCGLAMDIESDLQQQALRAFEVLGTSGWGRVDFLLDDDSRPWFLEVNTTPGMTDHSLVPQAAAQMGIGFDELIWRILETSL